ESVSPEVASLGLRDQPVLRDGGGFMGWRHILNWRNQGRGETTLATRRKCLRSGLGVEGLGGRPLLSPGGVGGPVANPAGTVNAIAVGLDGDIWYSESLVSGGNVLGRVNPATGAVIAQYPVASGSITVSSLVAGPDNAIWFTESAGDIGRLDLATGV